MPYGFYLAVLLALTCLAASMLVLSKSCRYYLKYTVYVLGVTMFSAAIIPVLALRPFNVHNYVLFSALCKKISRLIGLHWILRGREHLAEQKACVIVANHQSSLDILGMFEIWNIMKKCTAVGKKELLLYTGPFGLVAWLCGVIFVDRLNSGRAKDSMNKAVSQIKQDRVKLWIFPEGTRKNTGEIHPFKKGAFHVAVSAQIPILPIVFSPYYFLDERHHTLDSGDVIISALPPIPTEGLTVNDIESLMEKVRQCMVDEFMKMSKEVKSGLLPSCQLAGS